jgi:hypothetical protein
VVTGTVAAAAAALAAWVAWVARAAAARAAAEPEGPLGEQEATRGARSVPWRAGSAGNLAQKLAEFRQ